MLLTISNEIAKAFQPLTIFNSKPNKAVVPCRFTLKTGEVFRIPSTCQEVRVLSGSAWITVACQDIILTTGEKALLPSNQGLAILSALGKHSLTIEIL
jgi:hypothetical protein